MRFAPSPAPAPRSPASPRKCGNQPASGSTWTERGEDVAALPEDRLRAVPVVGVEVDDRNALDAAVAQALRRDRRVVEVAGAAVGPSRHVVPGRAGARVRGRVASRARDRRPSARVDGAARRVPRARSDRGHRVEAVVAGARRRRRRARAARRRRPDRGAGRCTGRPLLARVVRVARGNPVAGAVRRKSTSARVVDGEDRLVVVRLRLDEPGARLVERVTDRVAPAPASRRPGRGARSRRRRLARGAVSVASRRRASAAPRREPTARQRR